MKDMKNTKKLKILLLTDRLSLGGAETHLVSLYRELTLRGHYVVLASSGGSLSKDLRHVTLDLASHSPIKLIRGYFALRSLVLREGFDLIHAHARLPAFVASFVAKSLKIPLVTTVHAKFKTDGFRKRLSAWGFRSVAVSEDLRYYLTKNYSVPAENITVIENGINFEKYKKGSPKENCITVLFLSRLDSDCSLCPKLLCSIAPKLSSRYKNIRIVIGGGGDNFDDIKNQADSANKSVGKEVVFAEGTVCDVPQFLSQGDIFVGVSRCAIEAMATSLPVIIAGNEGFFGRLTEENFERAKGTNFCARGEELLSEDKLFLSLCDALDRLTDVKKEAERLYSRAMTAFDISHIVLRYEKFYLRAIEDHKRSIQKEAETLLVGYYGFSNLGDDALLHSAIERAEREFGGRVGAFTNKPKRCRRHFALGCYSRFMPFSLISRILRCDRVIFGGGTLFQDRTSLRSLIYYLFVLRFAQLLKKDTLLYANGFGEIKNRYLRSLLFKSLSHCSYIGVRDKFSYNFLCGSSLTPLPVVLENDLALSLSSSGKSRANFLITSLMKSKSSCFFVVCPHAQASRFDRFELELAIRRQKNKGFSPLFILCSPDDFYIAHDLKLKFGGALLSDISFSDLLSIFPLSRCVISMRYHPLLAARFCSVPLVPIGSDSKIKEFF